MSPLAAVTALKQMVAEFESASAPAAVLNMDDAGDIAPAAAMGMMIFYTNAGARILHALASRRILRKSEAWRKSG